MTSHWGEHRNGWASVRWFECDFHLHAYCYAIQIAIDDVREHAHALVERHVGDAVRHRHAAAQHAVGVDRPRPLRITPLGLVRETERTMGARIVVEFPA